MGQSIEDILNGPEYFLCEKYKARMKKVLCVEKQAGPQVGYDIDYASTMCRDCAQGIEIRGEIQGLDLKQMRRERNAFATRARKQKKNGKMDSRLRGNDGFIGAQGTVPDYEHIEKEGEEMAKCLVVDCEKEGQHRGLCSAHIQRYRKGTLPGVEPLPQTYGKGIKKDRIGKIKESVMRVKKLKAESSKLKGEEGKQKTEVRDQEIEVRGQRSEVRRKEVEIVPLSADIITAEDVQMAENRGDYRRMAVAFINLVEKKFLQETFDVLFSSSPLPPADGKVKEG